ncbi:MAG: helix-turn-helix transcriptional regulator [Lachnospiraceae bacterium]|nr:helix-turn-helix transcriptional regulator [Lachnospiraceae bacterium]MBQ6370732.1 helix-turn-helix transcriptional regulator [Bacillota bacterium]
MCQRIVQDQNIGGNLRFLRLQSELTQEQVAQKLQLMGLPVTREIYAQMEMGTHHIPITVLQGLRKIFKADWDEMLKLAQPLDWD